MSDQQHTLDRGGLHLSEPAEGVRTLVVAMNGVTGRMGYRQHLVRSILSIRADGGVLLDDGTRVQVEPVLVGRNADKLRAMAEEHGITRWSTDVDAVLADPGIDIYFDAQTTSRRYPALAAAMRAGKHIYTEKPTADTLEQAVDLARIARDTGIVDGVVHDKLYLPGLVALRGLVDAGFFGRIVSMRGEFGYWVWEGTDVASQRPSWNYRLEDGGGITIDMFPHWNYVFEGLLGRVRSVYSRAVTHIPERVDEAGQTYPATADDAAYAIFEIESPAGDQVIVQMNSSWVTRVFRGELVEFQVDGTQGSAVAGLRNCLVQSRGTTPTPVWNPDLPDPIDHLALWEPGPERDLENGFKAQWQEYLADVAGGRKHRYDLLSGARGVQLAELGLRSSATGCRVEVPEIVL
ncbi:MAG TPA: Gfo/Idh/MocA family oxidoreductase [Propionibacteriaceae bacterium]|nr:Gfo/Idh/MocA family oxidoreductase [Propionibacteriaceae bacterium]